VSGPDTQFELEEAERAGAFMEDALSEQAKQTYPDLKGRPDYSKSRSGSADSITVKE